MKYFRVTFVLTVFLFFSCKDQYKTIPSEVINNNVENTNQVVNPESSKLHTVVVNEILPTSNYTYLNVTEGEKVFWIAVSSTDAKIGDTYFYVGGLLKNNFESKALNKVFDELYLVGNLVSSNHGEQSGDITANNSTPKELAAKSEKINITRQKGSIKISEIVNNPKKYEGQTVQIDGECTKINLGIMGKNWIHLKDGSQDAYDLVITSDEMVDVGSVVTLRAEVVLDKDFGAGYKYDLILENGVIVKK
ncbi:GW dipeptide domain-containing protein [Gaetbulibacter aquiaggeris]|uniref:GW dipeptide domain-containing protein n=1 Tax=Gaetbulibacter aquiaggeris TaxID=1735373 RepID=A0ABW7MMW3_9FLAO